MARKNNPKQTVDNILLVSTRLFTEKGYDKTSMQDIVDALGMSKGAIFHHFKSKEEIFNEVVSRQFQYVEQMLSTWIAEMQGLRAKEKLMRILEKNLSDQRAHALDGVFSSQIQNPHLIVANMKDGVKKSAPIFAEIMREGVEDGSITTEFPDECAEAFFLLMNIWCDPVILECDSTRLGRRLKFLQLTMRHMGADIISDELIKSYEKFMEQLYERMSK